MKKTISPMLIVATPIYAMALYVIPVSSMEVLPLATLGAVSNVTSSNDKPCLSCNIELKNNELVIENALFSRRYDWNGGNIKSRSISNKSNGRTWELLSSETDFAFPVEGLLVKNGSLKVEQQKGDNIIPSHVKMTLDFDFYVDTDTLTVRRECRLFEQVAALQCQFSFKGSLVGDLKQWTTERFSQSNDERKMIEHSHVKSTEKQQAVMERLALPGRHWKLNAVSFDVATDYNDTLTQQVRALTFRKDLKLSGNLLTIQNTLSGDQLFILKESPSKADQLYYPGYDFIANDQNIRLLGLGVSQDDISSNDWIQGYSFVTGLSGPGELSLWRAIRRYQNHSRRWVAERDNMVLMNTWGDRSRDDRVNETFISTELKAAARLGITHFQIDDGWQAGLSSNSASASGKLWTHWKKQDWQPHPQRFPNGLAPLVDLAKRLDIELGIWFNPSSYNDYSSWQRDADILLDLYRNHGVRVFKIDGIDIQTKTANDNLRQFFDRVQGLSNGDVVFNLDVTAGRRPGYHDMIEYGNIFLENRYTDWANYYPYRTLRNLWMLSSYVPPQRLQIEFLNKWRNRGKYIENDPLAPAQVPFDYMFAITMFAQPLAWFEATGLPSQAFDIVPIINDYRQVQESIHAGDIFPIGQEPDGTAWTGFQSISRDPDSDVNNELSGSKDSGYILVFREFNDDDSFALKTWLNAGEKVIFTRVTGSGTDFVTEVMTDGYIRFHLPEKHSFSLYRYAIAANLQ